MMCDIVYKTDSDDHLINIVEKTQPDLSWDEEQELLQDMYDSWDMFFDR